MKPPVALACVLTAHDVPGVQAVLWRRTGPSGDVSICPGRRTNDDAVNMVLNGHINRKAC